MTAKQPGPSRREKEKYLKAHGYTVYDWGPHRVAEYKLTGRKNSVEWAHRLARRRQAARERAALRKAGFVYCGEGSWAVNSPHLSDWHPNKYYTRAEALKLAQGNASKHSSSSRKGKR